jgi:WW domain-containing oxidoreductase
MSFDATSTAEQVTAGLDLTGKTILITGVNSGLGQESARVLASRGARIIGLARTQAKAAEGMAAVGVEGVAVACDLSDLGSARAAVEAVRGLGEIDVLLANAGIMALQTLEQVDGIEKQLYVNHVGHFVLVTGLLDRLAADGRVVMLSSGAHWYARNGLELDNTDGGRDYDPWRMYGRSKLANIQFTRSLSQRLAGTDRVALSVHPGVIQTNLARHMPTQEKESLFEQLASQGRMKTVGQGAATQCYAAVHPDAAALDGRYLSDCQPGNVLQVGLDDAERDALWAWTEQVVSA